MDQDNIVLHYSAASRSISALWMLEELGLRYRLVDRDLHEGLNRAPDYLAINPRGQVPTLEIGSEVVSQAPAICMLLADRFSYGTLAPRIEEPDRGAWLKWMVYSTAVLEPATALGGAEIGYGEGGMPAWGPSWGSVDEVSDELVAALGGKEFILGSRFTAADVMLGSAIAIRLFADMLPKEPALTEYNERISARPAYKKASAIIWPS